MQTVPIELTPVAAPQTVQAQNFNQLVILLCKYIAARISTTVSFFLQGSNWPLSDQGIFFNQSVSRFGVWNNGQGTYLAITDLIVGDTKASFAAGDNTAAGWIQLDGRAINSVTGINQAQKSALESLFGANTNLPHYTFLGGLANLPVNGSFSGIDVPAVSPDSATVAALAIGGTYSQPEVQALRDATAGLDGSTESIRTAAAAIRDKSEAVLNTLNAGGGTGGPKWFVYVGTQ